MDRLGPKRFGGYCLVFEGNTGSTPIIYTIYYISTNVGKHNKKYRSVLWYYYPNILQFLLFILH